MIDYWVPSCPLSNSFLFLHNNKSFLNNFVRILELFFFVCLWTFILSLSINMQRICTGVSTCISIRVQISTNQYLCPCLYLLTCCLCQLSQTGLVLCQTLLIFSLCPYHPFSYTPCLAVSSPLVVECSLVSNVAKLGEGVSKFQLCCHTFKGKTMT